MPEAELNDPTQEKMAMADASAIEAPTLAKELPAVEGKDDGTASNEDLLIEEEPDIGISERAPSNTVECLQAVMQIPVSVDVVLGTKQMTVSELTALSKGSLITLDRTIGEPVDLVVNGKPIARGKIVMMEDGTSRFGLTLESIVGTGP